MPEGFGFKAWISVGDDKEPLQEYDVETDMEKKEVRCWIPSQTGKKFKVVWNNLAHYTKDTGGYVTVDGLAVGGKVTYKRASYSETLTVKDCVVTSPTSVRHFMFSVLKLTDDESLLGGSYAKDIGSISLSLMEIEVGEVKPALCMTVEEQRTVHERSKKGLVHGVGFAPEEKMIQTVRHADLGQQFGTFVFRYRPIEVLQANGIAPRETPQERQISPQQDAPSESDTRNKRKADDIKEEDPDDPEDDEEAKELKRLRARVRELEEKRANAKRVKTEPRPAFLPGEVIDLT